MQLVRIAPIVVQRGYSPSSLIVQSPQNKRVVMHVVCKILSAWELYGKYSRIRNYEHAWLLEDMPESGRLARAAGALVSACGLIGEEIYRSPSSSSARF
jgi:hypothetical protein